MCDPCLFLNMPPNKALQMDPHASRFVVPVTQMEMQILKCIRLQILHYG